MVILPQKGVKTVTFLSGVATYTAGRKWCCFLRGKHVNSATFQESWIPGAVGRGSKSKKCVKVMKTRKIVTFGHFSDKTAKKGENACNRGFIGAMGFYLVILPGIGS